MNVLRNDAGFSLIEVMVAILILGIALTGLVHGITTALASSKESELQTVAALFAQGKIEELRATHELDNGDENGDCGTALPLYRWTETIAGTDIAGLHEVSVMVMQAQTGREIYELKTMLFEPDDDNTSNTNRHKDSKSKKSRKGAS
ncbi:MAG TPA: prepilin-type N-terminal cleavage/methylation domain-containing protein [Verrucomicrobiae bacterium]|jgi:prepilin-type N-terminal cleavage/methylation domain-containing protein|nr:prepilin-type N-terminal cleavage/methylation domain-containing protein [Verrucomicrobiae bacterium]